MCEGILDGLGWKFCFHHLYKIILFGKDSCSHTAVHVCAKSPHSWLVLGKREGSHFVQRGTLRVINSQLFLLPLILSFWQYYEQKTSSVYFSHLLVLQISILSFIRAFSTNKSDIRPLSMNNIRIWWKQQKWNNIDRTAAAADYPFVCVCVENRHKKLILITLTRFRACVFRFLPNFIPFLTVCTCVLNSAKCMWLATSVCARERDRMIKHVQSTNANYGSKNKRVQFSASHVCHHWAAWVLFTLTIARVCLQPKEKWRFAHGQIYRPWNCFRLPFQSTADTHGESGNTGKQV